MAVKVRFITEGVDKVVDGASKVGSALGGVSKIAGGFVLGSGILKAPGFLLGAAEAAAADEQASARLATTLKNLGGDVEGMTAAVNDRIDAGQKLAFSDDDVRDSFQYLAQATNDGDEALRRQKIAMDLARGANISLDQASKLLGKTSEENTDTLKKLGIEVADGATEAEVLAGVQARFAGQSEAYAKSTAGQFEQAKLAMGEIVEGIGGAVLPILTKVGTVLAEHLPAIQAFVGEFATGIGEVLIPIIQSFIDFLGPVIADAIAFFQEELLPAIQEFLAWLDPKLQELGAWIQEQFAKFKIYYESDIKPALDNIIAGVSAVIGFIVEHWPEIWAVIEPIMNIIRVHIETIVGVLMEVFQILIDLINGDFSGAWEDLKELVGIVWDGIKETIKLAIDAVIELIKGLGPLMLEGLGNMKDLLFEAGKDIVRGMIEGIKSMAGEAKDAIGNVAGGIKDAAMSKLKINSPSLVFAEIGEGIMEGLEKGIFDEQQRPLNAMDKLAIGIRQAMDKLTTNEAGGGGPEAALKRMTVALLEAGYTMDEIEPNAKKLMETLSSLTNEAGDGAMSYEDALKSLFGTLNSLLATPAGDVVKAAAKPSGKENSSANASGGSLLGIGNAPKPGASVGVSNQGSSAQTKAAKEAAEAEATKRWQDRMLQQLSELVTVVKQGQRPPFGSGA